MGALTAKPFAFVSRNWELTKKKAYDFTDTAITPIFFQFREQVLLKTLPQKKTTLNLIAKKTRFLHELYTKNRLEMNILKINKSPYILKCHNEFCLQFVKINISLPLYNIIGQTKDSFNKIRQFQNYIYNFGTGNTFIFTSYNIQTLSKYKTTQTVTLNNFDLLKNNTIGIILIAIDFNVNFGSIFANLITFNNMESIKLISYLMNSDRFPCYGNRSEFIKYLNANLDICKDFVNLDTWLIFTGSNHRFTNYTSWIIPTMYNNVNQLQLSSTLLTTFPIAINVFPKILPNSTTYILYRSKVLEYSIYEKYSFIIKYDSHISNEPNIFDILISIPLINEFDTEETIFDFNGKQTLIDLCLNYYTYLPHLFEFQINEVNKYNNLSRESNLIKSKNITYPI
jgi:hypothetical protein